MAGLARLGPRTVVRAKGVNDFPYRVVYVVHDDLLTVLAVAHANADLATGETESSPEDSEASGKRRRPAGAAFQGVTFDHAWKQDARAAVVGIVEPSEVWSADVDVALVLPWNY